MHLVLFAELELPGRADPEAIEPRHFEVLAQVRNHSETVCLYPHTAWRRWSSRSARQQRRVRALFRPAEVHEAPLQSRPAAQVAHAVGDEALSASRNALHTSVCVRIWSLVR